jgi:predicted Zn-dependent protease
MDTLIGIVIVVGIGYVLYKMMTKKETVETVAEAVAETVPEVKKEEVKPIIEAAKKPEINTSKMELVSVTQTENIVSETSIAVDSVMAESIEAEKEPGAGFAADTVMEHLAMLQSNKQKFNTLAEQVEEYLQQSGKHQRIAAKKIEVKEGDQLIKEIKSSKKKQKSDAPQHTEQAAIIDQFIQARLEPIRIDKSTIKQDLTAPSETYSENVISETLVDILLRQGKKEKALEVLRKLIWKFPQKKALFAARIEELSK